MAQRLLRSPAERNFAGSSPALRFKDNMKKAYIIHGWGGFPKNPLYQWMKIELEKKGYEVLVPEMPDTENPQMESWTKEVKGVVEELNEESIFIGHSVGCQTILRYLESLGDIKVGGVILIAPWMKLDQKTIEEEGKEVLEISRPWMETPIDFEKVKMRCDNFVCIFSDNDPYVPLSEENFFKEKLGAKTLILNQRGHFDPSSGIKDLPEILDFIK